MKIADCRAIPLNLEMTLDAGATSRRTNLSCVLARIETDDGLVGTGFTAITEEEVVAAAIDQVAAPAIVGMDPMAHERIWEKLYWLLAPRGQSGYAMHAIAAIDLAVWDIKARSLGLPLWQLLGGSRDRVLDKSCACNRRVGACLAERRRDDRQGQPQRAPRSRSARCAGRATL